MPSDDYAPVVRGALKLKGSGPSGIKKKKKKQKASDPEASEGKKSAFQKALEEEDEGTSREVVKGKDGEVEEGEGERGSEERGSDGKTASERAYEEMRRKRVGSKLVQPTANFPSLSFHVPLLFPLDSIPTPRTNG